MYLHMIIFVTRQELWESQVRSWTNFFVEPSLE
jgi:hypothetical protein